MTGIVNIAQLKQLVLHLQGEIFPEYYPAVERPKDLCLPDEFWAQIPEIKRLINTDK